MKAFRHILLALSLAAAALLAAGCGLSRVKDISLRSVGVKYITPTSARSLNGLLVLGIENPAMSLTLSNVEGEIHYYDKAVALFTTGELPLEGKTNQQYELPCTVTLAEGASFLDLLRIAARRSAEGLTADVKLHAALPNGMGTNLKFNKIDITQFTD